MRTIGLIGGMSWESTLTYYRAINQGVKSSLGGLHSAQIVMVSVDFEPIEQLQRLGDWDAAAQILISAAQKLEVAGADAVMICTNTMHIVAPQVEAAINVPLLHIVDATGAHLQTLGYSKVALLGTAFTMEQSFYKGRLFDKFAIQTIVPNDQDRALVHKIIYQQLCLGLISDESRAIYLKIIDKLTSSGAQAVILGCTEIGMLVQQSHTQTKLLDTTELHAESAVSFLLA